MSHAAVQNLVMESRQHLNRVQQLTINVSVPIVNSETNMEYTVVGVSIVLSGQCQTDMLIPIVKHQSSCKQVIICPLTNQLLIVICAQWARSGGGFFDGGGNQQNTVRVN